MNELAKVTNKLLNLKKSGIFNVSGNERISKYEFGKLIAEKKGGSKDLMEKELLLSEIVFNIDKKSDLEKKLKLIQKDIKTKGFSNAALIHGISDTANNGGKLGWIKLSSLNTKIKNELENIKVGNISNPIIIPGGFLILKIVDQRDVKKNLDTNKAIELAVNEKTNEQLNKLSIVYYNKIKKNIQINVL